MCHATLDLISPADVPITLHVTGTDDPRTILDTLDRAEKIGRDVTARGAIARAAAETQHVFLAWQLSVHARRDVQRRRHRKTSVTGQWSDPKMSWCVSTSCTRGMKDFDTRK